MALRQAATKRGLGLGEAILGWQTANGSSASEGCGDYGPLYVYKVAEGMYEVDWQFTNLSEQAFKSLALAAYASGRTLPCCLVEPLARRRGALQLGKVLALQAPVTYGQLKFELW